MVFLGEMAHWFKTFCSVPDLKYNKPERLPWLKQPLVQYVFENELLLAWGYTT